MRKKSYDMIIVGAGIAGISAAYFLAIKGGLHDILIIDKYPPLSLTSDKSTECYRNWWPGPGNAMVQLMNRSIEMLEQLANESKNIFNLNRRGYLYLTTKDDLQDFIRSACIPSELGAGQLRIHKQKEITKASQTLQLNNLNSPLDGADLLLDQPLIQELFPYLSSKVTAALFVQKAGWFSAQQLGMYLLEKIRRAGVEFSISEMTGAKVTDNKIKEILLNDSTRISCNQFINAAGPFISDIASMLSIKLPVFCELHQKVSIKDHLGIIPRDAPLLIFEDSQFLSWSEKELPTLQNDTQFRWLLDELPGGVHTRPEGGADSETALMLWEYKKIKSDPLFPISFDPISTEIMLRGLSAILPGLNQYFKKLPKPHLDGGYYTRTAENRPLVCRLPLDNTYLIGALSGFGLMSSMACGELLAEIVIHNKKDDFSKLFSLERYEDPAYRNLLENWGSFGQL